MFIQWAYNTEWINYKYVNIKELMTLQVYFPTWSKRCKEDNIELK